MQCPQGNAEAVAAFLERFGQQVIAERIPVSGGINLTNHCNLRCVHCYLADQNCTRELSTGEVTFLIDQITAAGCLYFFFTGGEPLLRNDFAQIYCHARGKGLVPTIFTNATLVDDRLIDTFHEFPPHSVEVSLYGATETTYESVTSVRGSYTQCIAGIEKLLAGNIRVSLKTVLLSLNIHEYDAMEQLAKAYGTDFRIDPGVFPRLDGSRDPLAFRVSPKEAVRKEFSLPEKAELFRKYYEKAPRQPLDDILFNCGAGLTNFHIDAFGNLMPCVLGQPYAYNLLSGSFDEGWQRMGEIRQKKASWARCNGCERITLCGCCSGAFRLENGKETSVSEYICEIGRERLHFIRSMK